MALKPARIAWELETTASVEKTWALFSETDRYNRAVGFGFTFEGTPQDDGRVERTGTAAVMGLRFVWDELPFEYRDNEWHRIRRRFRAGPASDVLVTLRLAPSEGGTRIRYTIEATPRYAITRPIVSLELTGKTKPKIDRVLQLMLARRRPSAQSWPSEAGTSRLRPRKSAATAPGTGPQERHKAVTRRQRLSGFCAVNAMRS